MTTWKVAIATGMALSVVPLGRAEAQHRRRRPEVVEEPAPIVAAQVATPVVTPVVAPEPSVPPQIVARIEALEAASRTASSAEPPSDHSRVVGHVGIGLLGITSLPYPGGLDEDGDPSPRRVLGSTNSVDAPSFGVRYWFRERVGLDVGVGVAFGSAGGNSFSSASAETPASGDGLFALSLHAGLPLVLFHGRHYKFLAIPEMNLGFATGGDDGRSATDLTDDNSYSGFLFEAGGRLGAEIHFGFINLPFLALQISAGLAVRYESRTYENATNAGQTGQRFRLNSGRNFDLESILLHGLGLILYLP